MDWHKKISLLVLFTVFSCLPFSVSAQTDDRPRMTLSEVVNSFDVVALGNEYTGRINYIRKWKKPIRLGIVGRLYPDYFEDYVNELAGTLQKLTGHPVSLEFSEKMFKEGRLAKDFDGTSLNFLLFYLPAKLIPDAVQKKFGKTDPKAKETAIDMLGKSTCFVHFYTKGGEIKAAYAAFPARHDQRTMRACVIEELTQAMGLPNDSSTLKQSIFNDKNPNNELTGLDRLLLKLLYNPAITPGMKRDQALAAVRNIMKAYAARQRARQ